MLEFLKRKNVEEEKANTPEGTFGNSASAYAQKYSKATEGYLISEKAIADTISPKLKVIQNKWQQPKVLGVGEGTGQSARRLRGHFKSRGVSLNPLFLRQLHTEPNPKMAKQSRKRWDTVRIPRKNQVPAENLSIFKDNSMDAVYGSQTIHWWTEVKKGLSETYRTLKPGGQAVFPSSGIFNLEGGRDDTHFTNHPIYKKYLEYVKEGLVEKGLWNNEDPFAIVGDNGEPNRQVNEYFHRHTVSEVVVMMSDAGYENVRVEWKDLEINKKEMLFRLGPGAASMFIFSGDKTEDIPEEIREEVVNSARDKISNHEIYGPMLNNLDKSPDDAPHEPIPVFIADKPSSSEPEAPKKIFSRDLFSRNTVYAPRKNRR